MTNQKGFAAIAAVIIVLAVAVGGYFVLRGSPKEAEVPEILATPTSSSVASLPTSAPTESSMVTPMATPPTTTPIGPSDWLVYTNPTYHITMRYPPFYKYTKRTNAFEAQDKPFVTDASQPDTNLYNDHLKINILVRALNGYQDSSSDVSAGGTFKYAFSSTKGWYAVTTWPNQQDYLATYLPKKYNTKTGLTAYVSGKFALGSSALGWPTTRIAYIESPDKTFVFRLQLDGHDEKTLTQATDQIIYGILDTLQIGTSAATTPADPYSGWGTYSNDQYGFEVRTPSLATIIATSAETGCTPNGPVQDDKGFERCYGVYDNKAAYVHGYSEISISNTDQISCLRSVLSQQGNQVQRTFNGVTWTRYSSSSGAAGTTYTTKEYHTWLSSGTCFIVTNLVGVGNGWIETTADQKASDAASTQAWTLLDKMISSFIFK